MLFERSITLERDRLALRLGRLGRSDWQHARALLAHPDRRRGAAPVTTSAPPRGDQRASAGRSSAAASP
jgi:hypothetical protein